MHERSKQGKSLADLLSVHLIRFTSERTVNFRYSTTVLHVQYYSYGTQMPIQILILRPPIIEHACARSEFAYDSEF